MEENEKNYLDWEGLLEYHRNIETKLSEKANTEDLADVATSGDYNDLDNTPTNVSLFTNDAGYMTSEIDNTNGHDYVEIGGIKWATKNIGASRVTDIGLYFQWGDILGYTSEEVGVDKNFTWEDYKFNPSGDGTTFSKYNSTDLKTSLDTEDDAAANAWGSDWRVPTTSELQTLSQAVNISWTDNYQESGVPGLILTDKEDSSKVLFLPVTGVCSDGSIIDDDTTGFYWSKSLGNTDDKGLGLGFNKTSGTTWEYSNSRSLGFAIRPVLEGPAKRTIMGVTQLEKDKWNSKVSGIKIGESGNVNIPTDGIVTLPNQEYNLPTASANTLGGVKVGDNLSIDQNGVLSASPDEVLIGGNTPSSDSNIKIFIDTTEDSTAEIYTKQQQDGKFIVIKDLNAAPTESTLTYTENGTVKNFKQGDEVRVSDQDADNGYTFYKLYELTTSGNTTTATWDKLGAGEGTVYGTIIVNLEAYENDVKISLNFSGTQVTLTNTTDSQIVATRTLSSGDTSASFYNVTPLKDYLISVSDIDTFVTPDDISILDLAFGVTDVETMLYIKEDYVYVTIDQTQSDYNSMITVSNKIGGNALVLNTSTGIHQNSALLKLRNSSHLYLGTYANSKMTLKQLKDDDGTKYLDGTTANMQGSQGDHFLRIGEPFYIKRVAGSDNANQVTYGICVGRLPDNTWKQLITPNDLLGVHTAYANNNMLYSISNLTPSNIAISNFLQYAHNRGTGYICITWEWHCVMALLFWAWYSNTNSRVQCGNGGPAGTSRTTGLKDSFGMTDTTSSNGNTNNVKFWGIEDLWGNVAQISENIKLKYVNSTTKLWQVTDIKTGTSRTLPAIIKTSVSFVSRLLLSENLDLIPTSTDGGTDSTYYCTYYNTSDTSVTQDCYGVFGGTWCLTWNGVTAFGADHNGDFYHSSIGSRLAYSGQIEIINN